MVICDEYFVIEKILVPLVPLFTIEFQTAQGFSSQHDGSIHLPQDKEMAICILFQTG